MNKHIRAVSFSVFLFALIATVPLAVAAPGSDKQPNIVLVLMDNFGYGEIGVYGGGALRGAPTPRIDSIAAEGFQLTNFNVEAECTPSRTSLMTGRYGIRARHQSCVAPTRMLVERYCYEEALEIVWKRAGMLSPRFLQM